MKLALLAMAVAQPGTDYCPHSLVSRGHAPGAAAPSRPYTDCMTKPVLPAREELAARLEKCAPVRTRGVALARAALRADDDYRMHPRASRRAADLPFRWVDHIASNFPGCETSLFVAGDGREPPHAD